MFRAYGITFFITIIGTACNVCMAVCLAYPLARPGLAGRNVIAFLVFFTMLFNGGLVPTYIMYSQVFHIRDTIFALIIPSFLMSPFNVILMRNYFKTNIPDTAFGIGNLKGLVESLTSKPYDVVNTHFHWDHTAGNVQFEKVYCHRYDIPYLKAQTGIARGKLAPENPFFQQEDVQPAGSYEIEELEEGFCFELDSQRKIEVIHMPGHAAGGIMLLDHSTGMLFSGDAILATPTLILDSFPSHHFPEYLTVTALRDGIKRFLPRLGEVKALYPGHGRLGVAPTQITDMLECCEAIIAQPDEYEEYDYVSDPGQKQIKCVGRAMVVYSGSRV